MLKALALTVCCLTLTGTLARAAVVDFEDIAVAAGTEDIGGDRVSGGVTFDSSANHLHLSNDHSFNASNGTTVLVIDDSLANNVLTVSAATAFSLLQIDLAESDSTGFATSLAITGHLSGGGTLNTTFTFDGVHDQLGPLVDFETLTFSGWDNLISVSFDATAGAAPAYWAMDNLHVTPVPEPGSLALLLLGAVPLVARRRRR